MSDAPSTLGHASSAEEVGPSGRAIPADPQAMLYPAEAAALLALSPRTLESLRVRGGGPPFVRIGTRAVRYRRGATLDWAMSRERANTTVST
jgi:hypothetical protein